MRFGRLAGFAFGLALLGGTADAQKAKPPKPSGRVTSQVQVVQYQMGWQNQKGDKIGWWSNVGFLNLSKYPITNPTVRADISFSESNDRFSKMIKPVGFAGAGNAFPGVLLPKQRSRWAACFAEFDIRWWRRDVYAWVYFAGADRYDYSNYRTNPMQFMVFINCEPRAKVLAEFERNPAMINFRAPNGMTPILAAIFTSDVALVKALEKKGGQLQDKLTDGETALHLAAMASPQMFQYVAKRGVRPSTGNRTRWGEFHFAAEQVNIETFSALKKAGSDINHRDVTGKTALHYALLSIEVESVKGLVKNGASLKVFDNEGYGPMGMSATRKDERMLELVQSLGGSVREVDPATKRTALHMAVYKGSTLGVQWLVRKGANVLAKDRDGLTPIDYANRKTHPGDRQLMVDYLQRAAKDKNAKYGFQRRRP